MTRLQKWFDQIVGIAEDEAARRARAREIFLAQAPSLEALALPACWRRSPRLFRSLGI